MVYRVLSIDLAYKNACDLGICLLEQRSGIVDVSFLPFWDMGVENPPNPKQLASSIHSFCRAHRISVVMLDGPQGWKDRTSELPHMRVCERVLGTPAKTGVSGRVKPKNYTAFVEFSVETFAQLARLGSALVTNADPAVPSRKMLAVESFPMSAWRSLRIKPLPAKRKARSIDVSQRLGELQEVFGLRVCGRPNHDELQALVSGLGGLAIAAGNTSGYLAVGSPPKKQDGVIVEGFIVNPRR